MNDNWSNGDENLGIHVFHCLKSMSVSLSMSVWIANTVVISIAYSVQDYSKLNVLAMELL